MKGSEGLGTVGCRVGKCQLFADDVMIIFSLVLQKKKNLYLLKKTYRLHKEDTQNNNLILGVGPIYSPSDPIPKLKCST